MMNANKIAEADVLDILFDGRNKNYGAYTLRRYYNQRMGTAMGIVLALCIFIFLTATLAGKPGKNVTLITPNETLTLVKIPDDPIPPPPAVIQPPPPVSQLRSVDFSTFVITPDNQVDQNDLLPTQDDMVTAVISNITQDGLDASHSDALTAPPVEAGTGLSTLPVARRDNPDSIYYTVQNKAEFPGGPEAWRRFLERNLIYPDEAQTNTTQGVVKLEFIVDKEGSISQIRSLNDPGDGLAAEAIRILKKSPKWRPAEQNGHKVNYRHFQNITFRLE